MNEIEQMFYDALLNREKYLMCDIRIQPAIGIYRPDFILEGVIIEIDGHEYHKTKEQRERDYKRERYFQKEGYDIIRFMGTEVFLDPQKAADEAIDLSQSISYRYVKEFVNGVNS